MSEMSLRWFWNKAARLLVICSVFTTLTPPVHVAYATVDGPSGSPGTANASLFTDGQDTEPPSSPEALTTVAYPGYILVDWYGASDDTGITGYMIYRDGLPLAQVDGGTLSYHDTTVQADVYYIYRVETIDTVGNHSAPATTEIVRATRTLQLFIPLVSGGETTVRAPAAVATVGYSSKLRRYPYLTDVVANYATINWATDTSGATGYATWGKVGSESCTAHSTPAIRNNINVSSTIEYQWTALLTLTHDTQYCYRVFLGSNPTEDLLGSDAAPTFFTQIPKGLNKPFSFAVLGDWGDVDNAATHQAKLMQLIAASGARFAFTTGDNAYPSGNQTNYGDLVQTGTGVSGVFGPQFWALPGRSISLFPAQGNHGFSNSDAKHPHLLNFPQTRAVQLSNGRYQRDTYSGLDGTITKTYPSTWYAFDVGLARFYVLDAVWADTNIGTASSVYQVDYDYHWAPGRPEYEWLVNDLATHPSALKFAFFHYPLYSDNKAEGSDTYLQGMDTSKLEGLLISNGVKFAFNGHAHIYQRNVANGLTSYVLGATGTKLAPLDGGCSSVDAYGLGYSNSKQKVYTCGAAITNPPTNTSGIYNYVLISVNGLTVTVMPTDEMGRVFDQQTFQFTSTIEITAPTAPQYVTATATSPTQVNLIWTASTDNVGVTGYDIYRNGVALTTVGAVTAYADTTVTKTTTYQYQLRARDAAGNISLLSSTAVVTTPDSDATPPTAPSSVTATATIATQVNLTWTASIDDVGVTGYDIYRNGITLTTVGAVTAYTDTTVSPLTAYQYQLRARDASGKTSPLTSPVTVTTPARPPAVFQDGFESGNLSAWTTGVNLTVQTAVVNTGIRAAQANATVGNTYARKTLPSTYSDGYGRIYFNVLSAREQFAVLRFRTSADASLAYLFINSSNRLGLRNDVNLTTLTSATTVGSGWHALELRAKINGASSTTEVWLDGAKITSLSITTTLGTTPIGKLEIGETQGGSTRRYNVIFDDVAFNTQRIGNDVTPPSAPSTVTATAPMATTQVNLTWTAATDNVGVEGYDIYRNGSLLTTVGTVTTFADMTVSPATTYQYQLKSRDAAGNISIFSNAITVTTPAAPDITPPSTTNIVTAVASSPTQVDLTWDIATDNTGVTGYDIYRDSILLTTLGAITSYTDTTVSPVTTYQYQVRARDAAGNVSPLSSPVSVTTPSLPDITPPTVPSSVTATASSALRVDLTWDVATDDIGVTGYDIYRGNTLFTTVGAVTAYTDTTVNPMTTYQYQVAARDASGKTSALSSLVTVTTPALTSAVFKDGFESGDLLSWTVSNGLTVQTTLTHTGDYAAQANTTVGNTYAKKTLPSTYSDGYGRIYFNLISYSSQVNLLRFRTTTDGSLVYLFVNTAGKLSLRNDVNLTTLTSATSVGSGWHALELRATINGASSMTEVWLDGVIVSDLSITTNLGTTPIGKLQIGEVQGGRTYNLILDNAVFDIKQIGL